MLQHIVTLDPDCLACARSEPNLPSKVNSIRPAKVLGCLMRRGSTPGNSSTYCVRGHCSVQFIKCQPRSMAQSPKKLLAQHLIAACFHCKNDPAASSHA